jgi:hypothetical protein
MPARGLDAKIDRLYQLPLEEFTSARNALAKEAGADAADIRALSKPPIAAWAVNQLYWRDRDTWDALIEAAENARRAHKAVLSGRGGDVRASGTVHEEAADSALKKTLSIAADAGHPVTDATRQAIATTIRALPGAEAPGRLTRVLQPGGFEMLAGLSLGPGARKPATPAPAPVVPHPKRTAAKAPATKADAKALTRAREAAAATANAVRDAERAVQRAEFEIARTTREAERAARAIDEAREALDRAKTDLQDAEKAAKLSERQREDAAKRASAARKQLDDARERAEAAAEQLKRM